MNDVSSRLPVGPGSPVELRGGTDGRIELKIT